jgi:hypothetical protein
MKRRPLFLTVAAAVLSSALIGHAHSVPGPLTDQTEAKSIAGAWNMTSQGPQGAMESALVLKLDGRKVTGTLTGQFGEIPVQGDFDGSKLSFAMSIDAGGGAMSIAFTGSIKADGSLAGSFDFGQGGMAWTAVRAKGTAAPAPAAPVEKAVDVAGKWAMSLEMQTGTGTPTLTIKQDGEKLTGTYAGRYGEFALKGEIKGHAITFGFSMSAEGTDVAMMFEGEVATDGQTMKGDASVGPLGDATWSAKRAK